MGWLLGGWLRCCRDRSGIDLLKGIKRVNRSERGRFFVLLRCKLARCAALHEPEYHDANHTDAYHAG